MMPPHRYNVTPIDEDSTELSCPTCDRCLIVRVDTGSRAVIEAGDNTAIHIGGDLEIGIEVRNDGS